MRLRLLTILSAVILLSLSFLPCEAQEQNRPRVAVVLAGGGAKGMAHIGALKVIEEAGIPVDIITGTSMGAIVGGLYSIGYDSHSLDSMVRCQNWKMLLTDKKEVHSDIIDKREKEYTYALSKDFVFDGWKLKSNMIGVIEGKNLETLFNQLTEGYRDSMEFDSLPIPYACVATNIVNNTEYVFHRGYLSQAMRTSMSIPAVFAPIRKDSMLLVDGGLRNNYPADVAREIGADIIIGVTVQAPSRKADDIRLSTDMLGQIIDMNCMNKYEENLSITDVAIRVNPEGFSAASFTPDAISTLIKKGEKEARKHWADLLQIREKLGKIDSTQLSQRFVRPAHAQTDAKTESTSANSKSKTTTLQGNVGFRFDTEELAAIQVNAGLNRKGSPFTAETTIRLGERIKARLDIGYDAFKKSKMRLSYEYQYNDIDIYKEGSRQYNTTYHIHDVVLSLLNLNVRNFKFDIGAEWECFQSKDFLSKNSEYETPGNLGNENFFSYYANVNYNSENHWYFPTKGTRFNARYALLTDNLYSYNSHRGIHELSASWQMAIPITSRFTLQPMVYGRMINAKDSWNDIPYMKVNFVGGDWFGHYMSQQMPFAGIGHVHTAKDCFIACQLVARERLGKNHYIHARISEAQEAYYLKDIFKPGPMLGYQLGYYYSALLGPVGATIGYSNRSKKVDFYLNMGFEF